VRALREALAGGEDSSRDWGGRSSRGCFDRSPARDVRRPPASASRSALTAAPFLPGEKLSSVGGGAGRARAAAAASNRAPEAEEGHLD